MRCLSSDDIPRGKYESTPVWGPIDFPFRLLSIRERKLTTSFRGCNFGFRTRHLSPEGLFFSTPIWGAIYFLLVITVIRWTKIDHFSRLKFGFLNYPFTFIVRVGGGWVDGRSKGSFNIPQFQRQVSYEVNKFRYKVCQHSYGFESLV